MFPPSAAAFGAAFGAERARNAHKCQAIVVEAT